MKTRELQHRTNNAYDTMASYYTDGNHVYATYDGSYWSQCEIGSVEWETCPAPSGYDQTERKAYEPLRSITRVEAAELLCVDTEELE